MSTTPPPPRRPVVSRRLFLRLGLAGAIGAGLFAIDRLTQPVGPVNYYRWLLRGVAARRSLPPATVALGKCSSYDGSVLPCLEALWQQASMPDVRGLRVLVKPNLIEHIEGYPIPTDPAVVVAVVDLLAKLGAAEIAVGDGSGFVRDTRAIARLTGLDRLLAARNVPFVDLNYDDPQPVPARDGWFREIDSLWLPRHVREAGLIVSVPKLKTHHWAGASLSMKNLFGVVPGARYGWPKNLLHINGIPLSIIGLRQSVPAVVSVVDGIVGMEGDGPLFGRPVNHGLVAVGRDPVAVDATCLRMMGMEPVDVDHLALAAWAGIGQTERVETLGESPDALVRTYARAPEAER